MLASVRVLFDFVVFVVEAQEILIQVPVQAFFTDDALLGQGDRLLIRRQVRIPQPLLACDLDRLEPFDKGRDFDRRQWPAWQPMGRPHER
ncbi:hypothetical protein D3C87_1578740 [compost metagenome]